MCQLYEYLIRSFPNTAAKMFKRLAACFGLLCGTHSLFEMRTAAVCVTGTGSTASPFKWETASFAYKLVLLNPAVAVGVRPPGTNRTHLVFCLVLHAAHDTFSDASEKPTHMPGTALGSVSCPWAIWHEHEEPRIAPLTLEVVDDLLSPLRPAHPRTAATHFWIPKKCVTSDVVVSPWAAGATECWIDWSLDRAEHPNDFQPTDPHCLRPALTDHLIYVLRALHSQLNHPANMSREPRRAIWPVCSKHVIK